MTEPAGLNYPSDPREEALDLIQIMTKDMAEIAIIQDQVLDDLPTAEQYRRMEALRQDIQERIISIRDLRDFEKLPYEAKSLILDWDLENNPEDFPIEELTEWIET